MLRPFGNYLLDEEIARGGMARVYRARLRGLGGFEKTLVVKQVLPELARDPRFVRMFVEEAKTLVQMSHPHVVPVYELGVVDGVYFLAMEHVEGATLADVLRDGPLSPGAVAHVGIQVCDALHYAHRRFELVHRDVTPRNVIVDAAGHVRLLDFGIAAPADGASSAEVFGSPGYMSPEQARGERPDLRSDLFSLGVVLFEALTGERAFLRASTERTRQALLEEPAPTLEGRDDVPPSIARLVDPMLQQSPDDRPASAGEVARRLRAWLAAEHPEGVAPELGVRAEAARAREAARRSGFPPGACIATERADPSGAVRTLATSPALEAILGGTAREEPRAEPADGRGRSVPGEPRAGSDVPAPGDEPGTQPIPERVRAPGGSAGTGPAAPPDGAHPPSAREHRNRRHRRAAASFGLAALVLVGVAVAAGGLTGQGPDSRSSREPAAGPDRAPPTPRTDERASAEPPVPDPGKRPAEEPSPPPVPPEPPRPQDAPPSPPREPAAARSSTLTVSATPWAQVSVDGRPVGATPQRSLRLPAGEHRLELTNPPLGRTTEIRFESEPGQAVRVQADLTVDPPTVTVR